MNLIYRAINDDGSITSNTENNLVDLFTSAFDSRGYPIYENDFIICTADPEIIGLVFYDTELLKYCLKVDDEIDENDLYDWVSNGCEVVGNIYQK